MRKRGREQEKKRGTEKGREKENIFIRTDKVQDYRNCTFHKPHVVLFLVKNTCVLVPPEGERGIERERERERDHKRA